MIEPDIRQQRFATFQESSTETVLWKDAKIGEIYFQKIPLYIKNSP